MEEKSAETMVTVNIKCVSGAYFRGKFERTVEVAAGMNLVQVHELIQSLAGFGDDHLYTFFTGKNHRGRQNELIDSYDRGNAEKQAKKLKLDHLFPLPAGMTLFYWFDFGDDWIFQIDLAGAAKPPENGVKYPRVIKETGPMPVQYPDWEDDEEDSEDDDDDDDR